MINFGNKKSIIFSDINNEFYTSPFIAEFKFYDGEVIHDNFNQDSFELYKEEKENNIIIDIYKSNKYEVYVYRYLEKINNVYKEYTKVVNKEKRILKVCSISSLMVSGIFNNIYDRDFSELEIIYVKNDWCAEGEFVFDNVKNTYLPSINGRNPSGIKTISSSTTFTTKKYFPVVFFRDLKNSKVYQLFIEPTGNYEISFKIERVSHKEYKTLSVFTNSKINHDGDFYIDLKQNEDYETFRTIFNESDSIENSIKDLNEYKRLEKINKELPPIVYNDYLNSVWAREDATTTKALIDKAKEIGVDVYCMDSGWYKAVNEKDWFGILGDWIENDELFDDGGFKGIINYCLNKGLRFGMWFEFEVCTNNSIVAKTKDESWFLHLNEKRIFESGRYFLDLSNKDVRDYLVKTVERFYKMGVTYIKNDYNATFYGIDSNNKGRIAELEKANKYITVLYDEIKKACKGITIENCASGAMRSDFFINKHSDIQSFSDSEVYYKYPAIISGSLAHTLPEQLGIWTVCYPKLFENIDNINFADKKYIEEHEDAEETIFSVVSGFMGTMYLSGRLDYADDINLKYLKEGVETYKKYQDFISKSSPIYFDNISFFKEDGIVSLGLKKDNKMLLAVWHLKDGNTELKLDFKNIKNVYPLDKSLLDERTDGTYIKFDKNYQARLLEIEIKN